MICLNLAARSDDIMRDYYVSGVDMLLMDVQGYEDEAIKGAERILNS
jgi:hypothetical protein